MFSQASLILLRGGGIKRGHAWQRWGVHGKGWGVCMAGDMCGREVCMAGETATAADGTPPTGMHSYFIYNRFASLYLRFNKHIKMAKLALIRTSYSQLSAYFPLYL